MAHIKGFVPGMTFLPYPTKYQAKDGTTFQVVKLYDVASRNLGILRTNPDSSREVYGNELSAVPELAECRARMFCDSYNESLAAPCMEESC